MKVQIRKNIFETNSSSMHAITVTAKPARKDYLRYSSIEFHTSEFGWDHTTYYDTPSKAAYLWTALIHHFIKEYVSGYWEKDEKGHNKYTSGYIILDTKNPEYIKRKEAIRKACVDAGIEDDGWNIRFEENFNDEHDGPSDGGYIDHAPELDFVDELIFNEDRLQRFLFNDSSFITTWNDNEWYYDGEDEDDEEAPDYDENPDAWKKYYEKCHWKYFGIDADDPNIEWKYLKDN